MTANNRPYVLWRRVSTKQQNDSGLGLDAQLSIAEYFMHSEPIKVFTDVYSGTKLAECPDLKNAIQYCKKYDYLLVIAKTDRFRNAQEALAILNEIGEGNLCFCDLPTTDRTVLTMMFAIWERQAIMGRINTKKALDERRKQLNKSGYWISKSGRVCTHFGRPATRIDKNGKEIYDMSEAVNASAKSRAEAKITWREQSKAVQRALRKYAEGWTITQIAADLGELFDENPDDYCTSTGCKPSKGTVSKWLREANPIALVV